MNAVQINLHGKDALPFLSLFVNSPNILFELELTKLVSSMKEPKNLHFEDVCPLSTKLINTIFKLWIHCSLSID